MARKPSAKTTSSLKALGLATGEDGLVAVKMLTGASGKGFSVALHQIYRCSPTRAIRLVQRRYAQPAPTAG